MDTFNSYVKFPDGNVCRFLELPSNRFVPCHVLRVVLNIERRWSVSGWMYPSPFNSSSQRCYTKTCCNVRRFNNLLWEWELHGIGEISYNIASCNLLHGFWTWPCQNSECSSKHEDVPGFFPSCVNVYTRLNLLPVDVTWFVVQIPSPVSVFHVLIPSRKHEAVPWPKAVRQGD